MAHRAAGLPYLVHLRHPTTGGVYASWGSLGHVTVAEPGALVGFLGPKVFEALNGEPFPAGVQTAENLAAKGVIDAVDRRRGPAGRSSTGRWPSWSTPPPRRPCPAGRSRCVRSVPRGARSSRPDVPSGSASATCCVTAAPTPSG